MRRKFLRSRLLRDVARVVAVCCILLLVWGFTVMVGTTLQDPGPYWIPAN